MKIDAHHHLWKYNAVDYARITDQMSFLKRDFLPDQLKKEMDQVQMKGTIVVQAGQTTQEMPCLLEQAAEGTLILVYCSMF